MDRIDKFLIIFFVVCIATISIFLIWLRFTLDHYSGKDTYHTFGDGRFTIVWAGSTEESKILSDKQNIFSLGDIQRYIQDDPYIYIEGYISDGYVKNENGEGHYYSRDSITGKTTYYESKRETYRYVVLNYETGEYKSYKALEEIPEESLVFFEQQLSDECTQTRTCYEAP